jgi:hypothetical protein
MPLNEELHPALRSIFGPVKGDPPVLVDLLLSQVDETKRAQLVGLYLDAAAATLEANLKFVRDARSLVAGR